MKLLLVFLVACTSTRQLANVADPRLRTANHAAGFVVHTTEPWHERIDPNTVLRFHSANAGWSRALQGRELYVDREGGWIDRQVGLAELADAVRIDGLSPDAAAQLEATRPDTARLDRDGDGWVLSAPESSLLHAWLEKLELAIAALDPASASVVVCTGQCSPVTRRTLVGDDALHYSIRIVHSAEPLGTWRVYSKRQGWLAPVHGVALIALLESGRATKVGWRWDRVDTVEVENISGGKTLAAIVGTAAIAALVMPAAIALGALGRGGGGASGARAGNVAGRGLGGGGGAAVEEQWTPELAERANLDAGQLFSTGSRVRSIVLPTVAMDGAATTSRDLVATGVFARLRLADLFEIGGGVRFVETRDAMGWSHSTTGAFQIGLHLPLDAAFRFAVPLGFEIGAGGRIAHDLRIPWGLRYTSGRWFATVSPATPVHVRLDGEHQGRWSLASGGEIGLSF